MKDTTLNIRKTWANQSLPRGEHPCRKIVFTITSRDQGWGGDRDDRGTYKGSFTWFDVGIDRIQAIDVTKHAPEMTSRTGYAAGCQLGKRNNQTDLSPISCELHPVMPSTIKDPSDLSRYKFDHPFLPPATRLQSNLTATGTSKEHVITWTYDDCIDPESPEGEALEEAGRGKASANGQYVRNLKVGDAVTVWARTRFGGWRNIVNACKIDVYWAV